MIPLQVIPLTCEGCGMCCKTQRTPPFLDYEFPYIPADLLEDVEARLALPLSILPDDSPCTWFDPVAKRCRQYNDRPDLCAKFVVGSEDCLRWRGELLEETGLESFEDW